MGLATYYSHHGEEIIQLEPTHAHHLHARKESQQEETRANCIFCKAFCELGVCHYRQAAQATSRQLAACRCLMHRQMPVEWDTGLYPTSRTWLDIWTGYE